jgi:hypothetical protein
MKLTSLLFFLVISFSVFAQNKLDQNTSEQLNTRIAVGGKASKVLLDSLYSAYKNAPFQIYEDSNRYESGSTYLYNRYQRLKSETPKVCKDCDKKMQTLREISERETKAEMDLQYAKIINKADENYLKGEFVRSKELYNRAIALKPSDQAPKDALAHLETIEKNGFENYRYTQKEINRMVKYADEAFAKKDFVTDKFWYTRILTFDPNMQYAADRIVEIDAKLRSIQQLEQKEK